MSARATVGDRVLFTEEGFPLYGVEGEVVAETSFLLTVTFDNDGDTSTWRRSYFTVDVYRRSLCGAV